MRVVIAGSGRVGREVAQALSALGDDVSLLDESEEAFELLGRTFDGTLHVGVTYDVDALRAAGIEEADIFLALTPSDNANLMAVQLAERVFGVPRAIARLDDPAREAAYRALAVDFVPTARLVARVLVERVHEPEFTYHLEFSPGGRPGGGDGARRRGRPGSTVADLEVDGELRVAALQRNGHRPHPRSPATPCSPGDLVAAAVRRGVAVPGAPLPGGRGRERAVRIIIIGAGKIGRHLARELADAGHAVTVAESDGEVARQPRRVGGRPGAGRRRHQHEPSSSTPRSRGPTGCWRSPGRTRST